MTIKLFLTAASLAATAAFGVYRAAEPPAAGPDPAPATTAVDDDGDPASDPSPVRAPEEPATEESALDLRVEGSARVG